MVGGGVQMIQISWSLADLPHIQGVFRLSITSIISWGSLRSSRAKVSCSKHFESHKVQVLRGGLFSVVIYPGTDPIGSLAAESPGVKRSRVLAPPIDWLGGV